MTSRIACLTVSVACVSASADAALVLSNFQITSSRISFDLAGTVTAQQAGKDRIQIDDDAAPLTHWLAADRMFDSYTGPSFSIGSASINRMDTRRITGSYMIMFFNSAFVQGASVSGRFSFDAPTGQQFINLNGRRFKATIGGVPFATNLPAPGAIAVLGMTGLLGNRRRRA
jgi:hypothetical protein